MPKLVKKIEEKMLEYGMKIYDHYDIENSEDEHVFLVEDMIVFVREQENEVNVSYQATTRPDIAAKYLLILSETDHDLEFNIMDSFIYNEDDQLISGDEAYNLIDETKKHIAIKDYVEEQAIQKIFEVSKPTFVC